MHTRQSHVAVQQPVSAYMSRAVVVEHVDRAPKAALKTLVQSGQRHLAVVGRQGMFLGIASATAVANARGATLSCLVGASALHVSPGSCIREAASLMLSHGVDAVGVLGEGSEVVGILRWSDLMEMAAGRERP